MVKSGLLQHCAHFCSLIIAMLKQKPPISIKMYFCLCSDAANIFQPDDFNFAPQRLNHLFKLAERYKAA